jgi:hypothetical protein
LALRGGIDHVKIRGIAYPQSAPPQLVHELLSMDKHLVAGFGIQRNARGSNEQDA